MSQEWIDAADSMSYAMMGKITEENKSLKNKIKKLKRELENIKKINDRVDGQLYQLDDCYSQLLNKVFDNIQGKEE